MDRSRPRASHDPVSEPTIARLSVYLRCLETLEEDGVRTVSSKTLADQFNLHAALIRKDLAHFGEFGVRGVGYYVADLRRHLRQILGLDRRKRVVILGAGNLGFALADYPGFRHEGFEIVAMFDVARGKLGQRSRTGVEVRDVRELPVLAAREHVDIGVVAVPRDTAQDVVDLLVGNGIRAILNFAPGTLTVPDGVEIKNVDLSVSLESLSFFLAQGPHGEAAG